MSLRDKKIAEFLSLKDIYKKMRMLYDSNIKKITLLLETKMSKNLCLFFFAEMENSASYDEEESL